MVKLFILYELDTCSRNLNMNFTPGDCLFGSVKWTKNADPDKNGLSGYKIGFNASSQLCSQMVILVQMLTFLVFIIVLLWMLVIE